MPTDRTDMRATHETKTRIVEAALKAFRQFGIQRTTMSDIAKEAGLSRQTLYSTLGSKEEIVAETIGFVTRQTLERIKERLAECRSLNEQLDVYFEENVIIPFEYIQSDPGARDIWDNSDIAEHRAIVDADQAQYRFFTELLLPYTEKLGEAGMSPGQLAKFIIFVCHQLRIGLHDRALLDHYICSFKSTILTMATGRRPQNSSFETKIKAKEGNLVPA